MFPNKQLWKGTTVPYTCGLTDLSAGSTIETQIVPATVIATLDVTNTWNHIAINLLK